MQATTTTLGRSTGIHLECRTHHNVSETEIGLPDQRLSLIGRMVKKLDLLESNSRLRAERTIWEKHTKRQ